MNRIFDRRISRLINSGEQDHLNHGLKGLEKESLRITDDGLIAQTPHPRALGAALTHLYITTDYSEALLEFITPAFQDLHATRAFLQDVHQFVYDNLDDNELLLATSMPCGIPSDESVPIAEYGSSNIGRMKHIYRRGLAYRYGRTMQSIAGAHFNYSVPTDIWPLLQDQENSSDNLPAFIAKRYFDLLRNLQRTDWLILYLFGASPAICKSFLARHKQRCHGFEEFDRYTFYKPYGTSFRMSDIGYKSSTQAVLHISYNGLEDYVESLTRAIETPYPPYAAIGVRVDGEYRQLNSNILQIENEYYSSVRPKQPIEMGEKPTLALKRRGVRYVEIRSLDINAFDPFGLTPDTLYFIEALVLFCLFQESPLIESEEQKAIRENVLAVAYRGRDPSLMLNRNGRSVLLRQWALEVGESMRSICEMLDANRSGAPYTKALEAQLEAMRDPERTPSARILTEMRANKESFAAFAQRISEQHRRWFNGHRLDAVRIREFEAMARESLQKQQAIEASEEIPFERFLERYFAES